jgi:hypothetical protein
MNPRQIADELIRKLVLDGPALYNRASRRAAGVLSKTWRWDQAAFGNEPQAPRYIRRHYSATAFTRPTTRRQRKVRARITRIVARRGIA